MYYSEQVCFNFGLDINIYQNPQFENENGNNVLVKIPDFMILLNFY
jgi:hypothetical protein